MSRSAVSRLPKPCLGARDPRTGEHEPCGTPAVGGRCPRHKAMNEATRRPSPTARGYDRRYRDGERKDVIGRPCAIRLPGCTGYADTADHVYGRVGGVRPLGQRGRLLRPACRSCNQRLGNKGDGWLATQQRPGPATGALPEPGESEGEG